MLGRYGFNLHTCEAVRDPVTDVHVVVGPVVFSPAFFYCLAHAPVAFSFGVV